VEEVLVVVVVEHVGGADIEGGGLVITACAEALKAVGKAGIKRRID